MAYLDDHPPARSQYRDPRRQKPSGVVVVHTAENTPDFVAFDGGAEAVANFIRTRSDPGSYHDIADSDSDINLVSYDCEAYHDGTGSNPHSYSVSGATRADVWPLAPLDWRIGCVNRMAACAARYAKWLKNHYGIVIPARRINRSESELKVPGFISHAERDPSRRTDPGADFPWAAFLAEFTRLTNTTPPSKRRSGSKVLDTTTHPDGSRIDMVGIGPDHRVWHYTGTTVEEFQAASGNVIPGCKARSVSLAWVGSVLVCTMTGLEDDVAGDGIATWTVTNDGTGWAAPVMAPAAQFIDPSKV